MDHNDMFGWNPLNAAPSSSGQPRELINGMLLASASAESDPDTRDSPSGSKPTEEQVAWAFGIFLLLIVLLICAHVARFRAQRRLPSEEDGTQLGDQDARDDDIFRSDERRRHYWRAKVLGNLAAGEPRRAESDQPPAYPGFVQPPQSHSFIQLPGRHSSVQPPGYPSFVQPPRPARTAQSSPYHDNTLIRPLNGFSL
ncbi:hypothetical protein ISF_04175 [Cordyceps fumosorosea ARSEF 2679]|uniref:Uncharacterized protein n=1 Tax=Cordyceps fumosorosea (strain ARSEF 2679) TaxID=1081104 RepID=A0A167XBH7_CORFA|nr:hypothetical protein ISF_04175 [Cordyceps fumosorosea ARSEF 2679]OAA64765.1 hypothetical protein ISF_04175 [Cordyceps fumosorosea ARSEF 2679]